MVARAKIRIKNDRSKKAPQRRRVVARPRAQRERLAAAAPTFDRGEGAYRNYIKNERLAAGFPTQLEFAKKTGIEPSWFTRIENGRALAAPDELDAIANALGGVPLSRLYDPPFLAAIGAARRAVDDAKRQEAEPITT